jgi:hypothetical protein
MFLGKKIITILSLYPSSIYWPRYVDLLKGLITSYMLLKLMHIVLVHPKQTCSDYLDLAQTHWRKWQRMLQHERDQRMRLEDMVEQLARQLGGLEQAAKEHSIPVRDRGSECFRHNGAKCMTDVFILWLCCDACE